MGGEPHGLPPGRPGPGKPGTVGRPGLVWRIGAAGEVRTDRGTTGGPGAAGEDSRRVPVFRARPRRESPAAPGRQEQQDQRFSDFSEKRDEGGETRNYKNVSVAGGA